MSGGLIDTALIKVIAGKGGDGRASFRREKFLPKGGPDGGDGGNGGAVYFVADPNMATLMDFRSQTSYNASEGVPGGKKKMAGAAGDDLFIKVPLGTQVFEKRDYKEVLIGDMLDASVPVLVASGGRGGKGNVRFKSSINQTPQQYTPGTPGQSKEIRLEIKLIADVGLIGLPNGGKSTLVNQLTGANAKTDSYPFTTLMPNLGVCRLINGNNIIIADIPGLIEGASTGKGLGGDFLRHIERTRVVVHVVEGIPHYESIKDAVESAISSYSIIRGELENYGASLENKQELIVINKIDITEVRDSMPDIIKAFKSKGIKVLPLSAATGEGVDILKNNLLSLLENAEKEDFAVELVTKVYNIIDLPNKRMVFLDDSSVRENPASLGKANTTRR